MLERGEPVWAPAFEVACARNDIDHRLTKPKHPWTNGQVERMNRIIKDATVKRFYYETHDELRAHLADFVTAYNFARRLKTLKGLTPYEYICKVWYSSSLPTSAAPRLLAIATAANQNAAHRQHPSAASAAPHLSCPAWFMATVRCRDCHSSRPAAM